jgi:hypothetical protein
VIAGHQQLILRARARGLKVYGGTLTPVARTGAIEAGRQAVNSWIRTGGAYDAVIDFDAAVGDPDNPAALLPAFNSGDNIHPACWRVFCLALNDYQTQVVLESIGESDAQHNMYYQTQLINCDSLSNENPAAERPCKEFPLGIGIQGFPE